jgi:hypothetical protein
MDLCHVSCVGYIGHVFVVFVKSVILAKVIYTVNSERNTALPSFVIKFTILPEQKRKYIF